VIAQSPAPAFDQFIQYGALAIVAGVVWQFFRVLNGSLQRLARAVELNTRAIARVLIRLGDHLAEDEELRRIAGE